MIVAITGNIGSGKTNASLLFRKAGYALLNADKIGHELYKRKDIKQKVIKTFTKEILTKEEIDRKKLKNIVFHNHKELIRLNKIVHPEILKEIKRKIKEKKNKNIAIEGALLIETKFKDYNNLLLITIDKSIQIKRLLKKGKYNKVEINNIIKSQLAQQKKLRYADYIVDNSGTKKEFERNIKKIIKELK